MTRPTTTLILGGGVGGIVTANRLRRRLGREHRIVLVNRDPDFTLAASLLWVANGTRSLEQVTKPLDRLRRRGIEVLVGEIEHVDAVNRSARIGGRDIAGDFLVISLGADFSVAHVSGLAEHGTSFATGPGSQEIHRRLTTIAAGRLVVSTAAPLYRCPAAPYEMALLADAFLRRRGVRDKVEVAIRAAEPAPLGVAGPNVSEAVRQILASRDIDYLPNRQMASVDGVTVAFTDGVTESADELLYMPGITAPAVLRSASLVGDGGWMTADPHTLETTHPGVFAIGDNTSIGLATGKPLPRAGVFAHGQAEVVADNIASTIRGTTPSASFDGHGGCFIEIGHGRAGFGSGDFYAEPSPAVTLRKPNRLHHWSKALFEQIVLRRWL